MPTMFRNKKKDCWSVARQGKGQVHLSPTNFLLQYTSLCEARFPDMQSVTAGLCGGTSAASRALHSSKVAATGAATSRPDWCNWCPACTSALAGVLQAHLGCTVPDDAGCIAAAWLQLPCHHHSQS